MLASLEPMSVNGSVLAIYDDQPNVRFQDIAVVVIQGEVSFFAISGLNQPCARFD